ICVKQQGGIISHIYLDQLDQLNDVERGVVEHIDLEKALKITLDMDGELQTFSVDPQALMVARGKEIQIAPWNRQFGSKTVGQRSMSIFAGPMMNFVLAFVLFVVLIYLVGIPLENPKYVKIDNVIEGSVAEKANIKANDLVYKVNNKVIGADRQLLQDLISESADLQMTWVVIRNKEQIPIKFTPANVEGKGKIGVYIGEITRNPNLIEAIKGAGNRMWESTKVIFTGLRKLVTLQFKMDDLGGPIRIVEVTGEAVSMGAPTLVFWAAILSLYLGIFNLLPFPALDGSRLLFLGLEAVRGKPVSATKESMVHFIGFAMLMLLMLAVTFNDIVRLFKG
ncbi:MAG TPA: RIP metalloprotease RseP, partial [Bacilli bacterium]